MIFRRFKDYRPLGRDKLTEIVEYLAIELPKTLSDLNTGLGLLSFQDNFESFEEQVSIQAGAELKIRNRIRGKIPTKRIIVKGGEDAQNIVDGDTKWDQDFVYLKNVGASTAQATVIFMR